jgi:hypothetical protein
MGGTAFAGTLAGPTGHISWERLRSSSESGADSAGGTASGAERPADSFAGPDSDTHADAAAHP